MKLLWRHYISDLLSLKAFCERVIELYSHKDNIKKMLVADLKKDASRIEEEIFDERFKEKLLQIAQSKVEGIAHGLWVFRAQMIVAQYSLFERFLCHVVRVYLSHKPECINRERIRVDYCEFKKRGKSGEIVDYLVNQSVDAFMELKYPRKREYLSKKLHLKTDTWKIDDNDGWEKINRLRNDIVHKKVMPLINDKIINEMGDYLLKIFRSVASQLEANQKIPKE